MLATTEKVSDKDNKNVDDDDENDSKTSDNNDDDKKNSDDDSNSDTINDDDSGTTDGDDGKTSGGKDKTSGSDDEEDDPPLYKAILVGKYCKESTDFTIKTNVNLQTIRVTLNLEKKTIYRIRIVLSKRVANAKVTLYLMHSIMSRL